MQGLAQKSLLDYARRVYPKFDTPAHIAYIAGLLERMERGELRRICVSVPVRSGKSVLCSQIFPSWYVGRNPSEPVILASHAESLAVLHSRVAKHIVEDPSYPFEAVKMSADSSSVGRWNTTAGGGMYAVGVGGSITGRGFRLGIVDDPIHDPLSQSERDTAWRWFTEVFVPRAEPGASMLVVAARFAGDDLVGRLADSEYASEWTFVNLPAIAEVNDILGREPGEPIWPARMSIAELNDRRAMMGSAAFEAQFQQNPLPAGGLMFKTEWLEHTYDELPTLRTDDPGFQLREASTKAGILFDAYGVKPRALQPLVVQWCDGAWKTGPSHDRSCIATVVSDGVSFFVADVWADRVEYVDLKRKAVELYERWHPSRFFTEDAASGLALVQELKRSTSIPIIGIPPGRESKEARIEAQCGLFEASKIRFPARACSWKDDVMQEFRRFPSGKFDDAVESVCMAIREAARILRIQANRKRTDPGLIKWATLIP